MLKSAIEKIISLAAPTMYEADGHTYSSSPLFDVEPDVHTPHNKNLYSLDALVNMVKTEGIPSYFSDGHPLFIEITDYLHVECFLSPKESDRYERPVIYTAVATSVPGFTNRWMSYDEAMIKLRSMFIPNEGTKYLISLLANITDENSVSSEDNGVTQSVTVRKGIALQTTQQINPIVKLKPYRTFQEIDQPESEFLVRLREGGEIGFFEADGGMWQLNAREAVKYHLKYWLDEEIKSGKVVVML